MKLNSILGCALVAGLMAFAADKAQAGNLVISNEVYAPFNLKLSTEYTSGNKLKKASITSKQFLSDAGFNGNVSLAFNTTTLQIWVVNSGNLVTNLSAGGVLLLGFHSAQAAQSNPNKQSFKQVGVIEVFTEADQADTFDVNGVYNETYSFSSVDKNGMTTFSDSLQCKSLAGSGSFADLSPNLLPISGSMDYKGSGKILAE